MERGNTSVACPHCGVRMECWRRGEQLLFACQHDPCRWAGMLVTFEEATGDPLPPLPSPTAEAHERLRRQWAEAKERTGQYPL